MNCLARCLPWQRKGIDDVQEEEGSRTACKRHNTGDFSSIQEANRMEVQEGGVSRNPGFPRTQHCIVFILTQKFSSPMHRATRRCIVHAKRLTLGSNKPWALKIHEMK